MDVQLPLFPHSRVGFNVKGRMHYIPPDRRQRFYELAAEYIFDAGLLGEIMKQVNGGAYDFAPPGYVPPHVAKAQTKAIRVKTNNAKPPVVPAQKVSPPVVAAPDAPTVTTVVAPEPVQNQAQPTDTHIEQKTVEERMPTESVTRPPILGGFDGF